MSDATSSNRPNRRRYLRYLDSTVRIRLRGKGLLGRFRGDAWPMIDFNRFGLAFVHDDAMVPGTELLLDIDAGDLSLGGLQAWVRVSAEHADGWRIGVEFRTDGLRRSSAERRELALHELEKALKRR
ncbi:MAG TPA: hypothetical protein VLA56_05045 [Pseudomonadales bacterium]|nr:hypothetical protein [Pseudomonadales bacterium]